RMIDVERGERTMTSVDGFGAQRARRRVGVELAHRAAEQLEEVDRCRVAGVDAACRLVGRSPNSVIGLADPLGHGLRLAPRAVRVWPCGLNDLATHAAWSAGRRPPLADAAWMSGSLLHGKSRTHRTAANRC